VISGFATKQIWSAFFWSVTQRIVVIPYRRFLKMGLIRRETSVRNWHYTLRNIPEERRSWNAIRSLGPGMPQNWSSPRHSLPYGNLCYMIRIWIHLVMWSDSAFSWTPLHDARVLRQKRTPVMHTKL
jgi:hypothetical protein